MSNTVISIENVSKKYNLGVIGTGTFKDDMRVWWAKVRNKPNPIQIVDENNRGNSNDNILWALKDVSFKVEKGQAIGIIGRNGAGKSTLLKILSRVTTPTSGEVKVKGRIASLLEVGTGFHPELTGRENVFLNGAIMGMSRDEVIKKFDEIIDFSGVEKFIDTPVKRYSSGMYVRLAFAVAAHLEPEILIVDEVLAVGDAEFQKKCIGKMGDVAHEGRTVLFVSHNMGAIKALCSKSILLASGSIAYLGDTYKSVNLYLGNSNSEIAQVVWEELNAPKLSGSQLSEVGILNEKNIISTELNSEKPFKIYIKFKVHQDKTKVGTTVIVRNSDNSILFVSMSNQDKEWHLKERSIGEYVNTCEIPPNIFSDGRYTLTIGLWEGFYQSGVMAEEIIHFSVHEMGLVRGDLPYELKDGLIRPLFNWTSRKVSHNER